MRPRAHKVLIGLLALACSAAPAFGAQGRPRTKTKKIRRVPVSVAAEPPPVASTSDEAPLTTPELGPPFLWRQVFAAPSSADRVVTFTIDHRDPRRIFVGTEEGRILRTTDLGTTWLEIDPQPFLASSRSHGVSAPRAPDLDDSQPSSFEYYVTPPDLWYGQRIRSFWPDYPFPLLPDALYVTLAMGDDPPLESMLAAATTRRPSEVVPIRRIAVCPGARYEVFVATERELLGSMDGGLSYVRLFANPGGVALEWVACSSSNPNYVVLTSQVGLFVSRDGGLTFDQDLTAAPGQPATVAEFGPMSADGRMSLYSTSDSELYAGDPDDPAGLHAVYPGADPDTAPWLTIRHLVVDGDDIWLATDDGVRRSRDRGRHFETVARMLLSRQSAEQVVVGENESGGRRVAVMVNNTPRTMDGAPVSALHDSVVYSSDDGGETWVPFFFGLSRRTFRVMSFVPAESDRPASWWVATSGEIWTTAPFVTPVARSDRADVLWAKEAIERTPPLHDVIARALDANKLSNEAIVRLADRHRFYAWVPRIDARFQWSEPSRSAVQVSEAVFDPELSYSGQTNNLARGALFEIQATWSLSDAAAFTEDVDSTRTQLHELRRQLAFAVEDAWHERAVHLQLMSQGLSDPLQVLTLKSRIEALDVLLAVWTDQGRKEER